MDMSIIITDEGKEYISSFEKIVPSDIGTDVAQLSESLGFSSVLSEIFSAVTGRGSEIGAFFLLVFGICILMSLASLVSGRLSAAAERAVMLVSGVAVFSRLYTVTVEIIDSVGGVLRFYTSFVPIMSGVLAWGGGTASAASGTLGANMTLGIIGSFVIPFLNSAVSLIFALGLIYTSGTDGIQGLAKRVRGFFMWLAGIGSVLLIFSLTVQTSIASSRDTAALRAAKYAASGTIPVVGGTVSSAMGALATSATYIKETLGAGALAVILLISLSPLVSLLLYRFVLSFGEGMLEFFGINTGVRIFGSFRLAFDLLLATYALTVTVLLLETALLMKSGVGAF